jgi:hypothetical protein
MTVKTMQNNEKNNELATGKTNPRKRSQVAWPRAWEEKTLTPDTHGEFHEDSQTIMLSVGSDMFVFCVA